MRPEPKVGDHVRVWAGPNGFRAGHVYVVKFVMNIDGRVRVGVHGQAHLLDSGFKDCWEVLDRDTRM